MTRKALGRGINALFSGPTAVVEQGDVLQEVDVDLLEPNADQPRTIFREAKLDELAASIAANGIVQPLLVRRQGERFQIIAGASPVNTPTKPTTSGSTSPRPAPGWAGIPRCACTRRLP